MSYVITSKGDVKTYTVKCDEQGCKQHFDSTTGKGDAWQQVKAQGWFSDSASNHRCVEHKPVRATRKVTKTAVAQTKAEKANKADKADKGSKTTTTKSGAKLTVGARVAPKTTQPAVAFTGGQSIGKKARSAKSAK